MWVVDRDVKKRRDKEKALDDQVMELIAKNEYLIAENSHTKETLLQQIKLLTIDNERLQTSLALSQARVVSGTSARTTSSAVQPPKQEESNASEEVAVDTTHSNGANGRQTRLQSQLARSQEQHTRELLLNKTRSRPSYIPKPSTRKIDVALLTASSSNKENANNNSTAEDEVIATQTRKTRASMIPIRKGSSLLPPQVKALRS